MYIVVTFWPNYLDNEFPLFTDLTVFILFIPCFYLLGTGIPSQIIWQLAQPPYYRWSWLVFNYAVLSILVMLLFDYSMQTNLMCMFIGGITSAVYLMISRLLHLLTISDDKDKMIK
ncbi:hypothetical protein PRECH8_23090 [Insulibacter thermoxylanivorax]|uniref:Uncharacterized protein n=1 Tax=Insulibacter thermoxylanivorax TaxID=2749268 RepID=A0A916QGH3_9BACL|nr:hypothetical protein PRECH8_23090 [Insulibacter thermoxylanivorax]